MLITQKFNLLAIYALGNILKNKIKTLNTVFYKFLKTLRIEL